MISFIKTALVAVSLATAGLAASAPAASAGQASFTLQLGGGHHYAPSPRHAPRGHWDRGGRGGHWDRGGRGGRGGICAPGHALQKGRGMGIRHARIVDANRRVVRVDGRSRGTPVRAVFANDRGCPVIRVR